MRERRPFERIWVQPAGDSGTSLRAAMFVANALGEDVRPMPGAALGRTWSDDELEAWLHTAPVPYTRPDDIADSDASSSGPSRRRCTSTAPASSSTPPM